jgi:hypothetical protein
MRRAAVRAAVGAALWCAASCLNIKDVVQPAEVEAGKKFEVAVELRSYAGLQDVKTLTFAGVVAVSIPGGAEVIEAKYEGEVKGRLAERAAVGAGDLPERPGYKWVYFVTPKTYNPVEYVGKDYTAKLTMRAPDTAGDYVLGYAAGAVTAEGSNVNYDSVYWGTPWHGENREPVLERGITVK